MRVIKRWGQLHLSFDEGNFDQWRVGFHRNGKRFYPTDVQMFEALLDFGDNRSTWRAIWNIAKKIQKGTDLGEINITGWAKTEDEDQWLHAIAAMMLAEEEREGTKLGKKIKLLGLYQVLVLDYQPEIASNWTRGMPWRDIDYLCNLYGLGEKNGPR